MLTFTKLNTLILCLTMVHSLRISQKHQPADHNDAVESGMNTHGTCRLLRNGTQSKKIALLLRGGSFRDDNHRWCSNSKSALEYQTRITQSHLDHVVQAANQQGLSVDIFIATYNCDGLMEAAQMNNLFMKYGAHVKSTVHMNLESAHQGKNMHAVMELLMNQIGDLQQPQVVYSHIIITRLDELLTAPIITTSLLDNQKILLGKRCKEKGCTEDELFIVPWSLLHCWSEVVGDNWCFSNDKFGGMGHCCCAALSRTIGEDYFLSDVDVPLKWHPWELSFSKPPQFQNSCHVDVCVDQGPWDHREIKVIA